MKLLVYETTGDWTAALRREAMSRVAIIETRSFDDLWSELSQSPIAVVGIEIAENRIEASIEAIRQLGHDYPNVVTVTLASRKLGRYEAILRESGTAHVVFSIRQAGEIAAIANRRLAALPENDFNAEETTLEQQILARLPWG